ncbi:HNH endonuclease [Pseudanabaena phage Pam3]|nr:HNH endonuclease [Pseudanabaena phage Pam3]
MIEASQAEIDRFMKLVDKLPSGCWFWTGARSRGGNRGSRKWYGTFYVNKEVGRVRSHRFSCEVIGKKGPLPRGYDRSHKCHFSLCVNPDCIEYELKEVNQARRIERARKEKTDGSRCLA